MHTKRDASPAMLALSAFHLPALKDKPGVGSAGLCHIREAYKCTACGELHDPSVNAALNIKAKGIRMLREDEPVALCA